MTKYKINYHIFLLCTVFIFAGITTSSAQFFSTDETEDSDSTLVAPTVFEPGIFFPVEKSLSTSSVFSVSGDLLDRTPSATITNTLYGLIPGLVVGQRGGEPGNDVAELYIRGAGSYNVSSYAIYVDGFQTTESYFHYLSPSEIESVSILKDAAALAPFGMRGANGVIWIETKRGRVGPPRVKIRLTGGIQQPVNLTKPLASDEFAALYNEAVSNDNGRVWTTVHTPGTLTNTDWYAETLKSSAPFYSTDLTFDGGDRTARYFIMLGVTDRQGLYDVKNDDTRANIQLRQYNIRTNFDFTLFDIFDGKIELGGRIEDRKQPAFSTSALWNNLERYPNHIYPVRNENGTWTGTSVHPHNPVASITDLGYNSTHDRLLQVNFSLKERLEFLLPGLYLSQAVSFSNWTRGSYNVTRDYTRIIDNVAQTTNRDENYRVYDDRGTNQWEWMQFQVSAGYDGKFEKHAVSSAVSYLQHSFNTDANRNGDAGVHTKYNSINAGGRLHYAYDAKYSGEFGFSYSGSDNFRKGNRFGFYPALSAAWILSKESFLDNSPIVDFLKLRASVGKTAYDPFHVSWWSRRYLYQQYYTVTGNYLTGNATPTGNSGIAPLYVANPDIFAEECMKYNIGLEALLFSGLNITVDAFINKRSGIASQDNTYSALIGVVPPMRNIGEVTTSGIEAALVYSGKIESFRYSLGGNFSLLKDKIDFMAELPPPSPAAARTGSPIGEPVGLEFAGFYNIGDFDFDGALKEDVPLPLFGSVQPGDLKYRDVNDGGDGFIDERDLIKIGKSNFPDIYYSFTVEFAHTSGFDFRALFQGVAGREVNLLNAWNKTVAFLDNGNAYPIVRDRWAYYPEQGIDTRATANYPRLSTGMNENNYRNSTFWMKNGNFLRLKNIEIGYTLPSQALNRIKVENIRIFVSGVNLFTFSSLLTDYDLDPERLTGYPALKSYNAGISVNF